MMGAEIFVPGGVLGVIGGLALFIAMGVGFKAFGPSGGITAAFAIIIFLGLSIVLWMVLLPKTSLGKKLTLSTDISGSHSQGLTDSPHELLEKEGIAITHLRPSGIVRIEGQRMDVVAEGTWIEEGARIKVIRAVGNHVTVRKMDDAQETSAS